MLGFIEGNNTYFRPEEAEYLIDFIQAKRFLALLQFTHKT